ncbi:MAG: hypothetical protein K2X29_09705, partial [Candidatus Obscuribacterales bacterium]|nr:hypothetical protein [Candidatus Obscuribacterales bacterium]
MRSTFPTLIVAVLVCSIMLPANVMLAKSSPGANTNSKSTSTTKAGTKTPAKSGRRPASTSKRRTPTRTLPKSSSQGSVDASQKPIPNTSPAILKEPMNVDSVTLDKFGTGGSSLSDESLQVNFVISEPASLIRFMDSISQRHHTTEWLHDWYFAHRGGDTSKDRKLIEDYRKMMDTAGGEFIDESGRPQDLNQRLITVAAQCNGMPDFLPKIKGLMKANEYTKLKGILEHFDPIFRALVWEQRYSALESQLKEYQHWAVKSKLSERLLEVKRFLKAPWVKGLPFTIVLVPLPKPDIKKAGTHGESLGKVQLVELLPESDFQDFADVVFHEMCHALWHTRKDLETVRHDFEKAGNYVAYAEL